MHLGGGDGFLSHQTFFLNVEPPSPDKDFHYFGKLLFLACKEFLDGSAPLASKTMLGACTAM